MNLSANPDDLRAGTSLRLYADAARVLERAPVGPRGAQRAFGAARACSAIRRPPRAVRRHPPASAGVVRIAERVGSSSSERRSGW